MVGWSSMDTVKKFRARMKQLQSVYLFSVIVELRAVCDLNNKILCEDIHKKYYILEAYNKHIQNFNSIYIINCLFIQTHTNTLSNRNEDIEGFIELFMKLTNMNYKLLCLI